MTMPMHSYEVPGRSRDQIINAAVALRQALRINHPKFPILQVVEVLLPEHDEDFSFEVKDHSELGEQHGLTRPELKEMWIREDVYEGARRGNGRDRFTIAHELGHYLLHNEPGLARTLKPRGSFPFYKCAEWQANSFAGALLIPTDVAQSLRDPYAIAETCGVSVDAANVQLKVLAQKGLLK
nr:ImmA/IrrE family metallo-endopeptidase [Stenotrophomonas maltophilia]